MSSNHPGCFGSPLCFKASRSPCSACPFAAQCETAADARGKRLRERYGVSVVIGSRETPRLKRTPASAPHIASVSVPSGGNKKAMELITVIRKKGIDVEGSLRSGVNPFDQHPPAFMRIAVNELMGEGIDRTRLRHRYVSELGWSAASASSHVGIATGALVTLGVAQSAGAGFVMGAA